MKKLFRGIILHPGIVWTLIAILILFSLIGMAKVKINYDMSMYLPKNSFALQGKEILSDEFNIQGTANIAVKRPLAEVVRMVKEIEALPNVDSVIWLGSGEDVTKPVEFMLPENVKGFYRDGWYKMQVFFVYQNDDVETVNAMSQIREIIGEDSFLSGTAAISYDWQTATGSEMGIYYALAGIVIYLILMFSLNSLWVPLLFFINIGIAILLNAGSNIIFGTISNTTASIFAIIQLAVSMDYSIFLLHRYEQEKLNFTDPKEAMTEATFKTFSAIAASGLTTIGGFLALVFMQYGFGKDLGLVMAKGVFFSLISAVTILPLLLLRFDEFLMKHRLHFPRIPSLKLSSGILKLRWSILLICALFLLPSYLGANKVEYYYATERGIDKNSRSVKDNEGMNEIFNDKNQLALLLPRLSATTEHELSEALLKIPHVSEVLGLRRFVSPTIPEFMVPEKIRTRFQSDEHSLIQISIDLPVEGALTEETINNIIHTVKGFTEDFSITGEAAVFREFHSITNQDFKRVNWISIAIIAGIILLTFKSVSLPVLLVFVIEYAIWINVSIPYFAQTDMSFISFIIIGAIQLGATVDYAILYTSLMKEYLAKEGPSIQTSIHALKDTLPSVMTSSFILFAGTISVYLITKLKMTAEMTLLIGRGALISFLLVVTLLPSLFYLFEQLISKTGLDWKIGKGVQDEKNC